MKYTEIIKLVLPIYLGMLASTLVGLVDTFFLGKVGLAEQSAAGYGTLLQLVFFVIGFGFILGVQILIARKCGEGRQKDSGILFYNGLFFMLLYAALLFALILGPLGGILNQITSSKTIGEFTINYLQYRAFGIFGSMANLCFIAFYVGTHRTSAITISSVVSGIINIVLDYALIFGHFGFQALGLKGAAIASGISEISGSVVFLLFLVARGNMGEYGMNQIVFPTVVVAKQILRVSGPLIIQNCISILAWFVFFTLIEKTGDRNFGISVIARSIYSVFMIFGVSMGSATNSIVSNYIGQKREGEIFHLLRRLGLMSFLFMFMSSVILLLYPAFLFGLFTTDVALANESVDTLYMIFAALQVFAVGNVLFNAVSGTGLTLHALAIESICIFLYLIYTLLVTRGHQAYSLSVIWFAEALYMGLMGILSFLFLRYFDWKSRLFTVQLRADTIVQNRSQ
jgi:multidrug resistance protein, MATE family